MASDQLTKEEQNFIRFGKACDDVMILPLADILHWKIKPKDLYKRIQSCQILINGEKKLDTHQLGLCKQTNLTDYCNFDVSLLYKLIRNLCPTFKPTQGWGITPKYNDIQIGDDIERIRVFRNEFKHRNSSAMSDSEFRNLWTELEFVIQRLEKTMSGIGYNTNYERKIRSIEDLDLGNDAREKYKTYLVLECLYNRVTQTDDRETPEISLTGNEKVLCGETAVFEASIEYADPSSWLLTWQKETGQATERIDICKEKYKDSIDSKLVITPVSKEDEGRYCAVLSRKTNGNEQKILSNKLSLQALGERPCFDVWKVSTELEDITIHFRIKDESPKVQKIEWTRNKETLNCQQKRYGGGSLCDKYLTIKAPTIADRGEYSCTVTNAVGPSSKDVQIDVPYAGIATKPNIYFGSQTYIDCDVASCPPLVGAEWQKSIDRETFKNIDISEQKYYGSNTDIKNKLILVIPKVCFEDKQYYRLRSWNKIGEHISNTVYIRVKGDSPDVLVAEPDKIGDSYLFAVTIRAIPAPSFVQWSVKGKDNDTFEVIDINAEKYKGTSNSLPSPVLVVKEVVELETCCFQIEVQNFIGSCKRVIPADMNNEHPKADVKTNRNLGKLYLDRGASVLFAKLFDELAEGFPKNQINRLQDLINNSGKVEDTRSLNQAICARDCFRILRDENLFTNDDVIFTQYLLKTTHCQELYTKCLEYAKAHKALCYYEMPPENGFTEVRFHVQGNLKDYNQEQIDIIKETVATILRCTINDIFVSGFDHSSSFFVIISIRQIYIKYLFSIDDYDKEKLIGLHIDYFIMDCKTVYLKRFKEQETLPSAQQDQIIIKKNKVIIFSSIPTIASEKETIQTFLHRLGLDDKLDTFKEEDITLDLLLDLSENDLAETLREMKLTIGKQMKIRKEINYMNSIKDAVMEKESSLQTTEKDDTMESIESWKDNEIRMILIGKTGSGKSATGNTILGIKHFTSSVSGSSITSKCLQTSAVRFGHKILIVDTPGIFDTKFNKNIQKEILKCISITSPGPHAFILVINIARYTEEEQKSVQHFVDSFGEKIFRYLIVLLTRKDDLDEEGITIDDHIASVPQTLQTFIAKCGRRVIAFNNRLKGDEGDDQVRELLSMIYKNVEENNGECYTDKMYEEAEKHFKKREDEIRKKAQMERDKELQAIQKLFDEKFLKEAEKHKTKTKEEFKKWQEQYQKKQEEERKAKEEQSQKKYDEKVENLRDVFRKEVVEEKIILDKLWDGAKLVFPGFFTSYF